MVSPTPGANIPFTVGYDARSRRKAPRATKDTAAGYLRNADGDQLDLWVTDVTADFAISGQVGQSRMLREWFPRSFNAVTMTITGNVASTQDYNGLATFIRVAQWKALQQVNAGNTASQTLTFGLYDRTPSSWGKNPRGVKGAHRQWTVNGYVKSIQAGATHWEVAPAFTIAFIVAESQLSANTGIWSDVAAGLTPLSNILSILGMTRKTGKSGSGFVQDPVSALEGQYAHQQQHLTVQRGVWSVVGATEQLDLSPTDWFG